MKNTLKLFTLSVVLLAVILLTVPQFAYAQTGPWLAPWSSRQEVSVPNPCGTELTDYQVQITLDATFDFDGVLPDGSDLVITGDDAVTCIPFWIEAWEPSSDYASIWVKVPSIPLTGALVYLYYGKATPEDPDPPELVEVGPIGPWEKQSVHIIPIGDPGGGAHLLAENMVYDSVSEHYWLVFANYNNGSVGLVWSNTPDNPNSWTWHGTVVTSANSPHIIFQDSLWYIFYADRSVSSPWPISYATSATIDGVYTKVPNVLLPGVAGSWEDYRVDEPYVFQRSDLKWIMAYMGDAGNTTEQVGYAEADFIYGPYTKYSSNPCIPFGSPGSYDAGTVADPWVVEFDGVYYIGYTVSPTKSSPWNTALVTTEDWLSFTKHGEILDLGGSGDWDEFDAFRGAVTRFGDTYYFPYTGSPGNVGNYVMGMATMDAFQYVEEPNCHDADAVFEFIDNFDGDALDTDKWFRLGGSVGVAGGICTLTGNSSSYLQMRATTAVGTGTLLETYASHLDAGFSPGTVEGNTAAEVGYKAANITSWSDVMRIMDWPNLNYYCMQSSSSGTSSGYVPTSVLFNSDWHTYKVYRTLSGDAEFQVDANPSESLGPPYVSTSPLYPWLMSYSRNTASQSRFLVDWIRVRKWCGTDVSASVGSVEYADSDIFGHVYETSIGLEGVDVMVLDSIGNPYAAAITDGAGYYDFKDLPDGEYSVTVSTPLGYEVDFETHDVTLVGEGVNVEIDFILTKMANPMAQRGRGYWMHQVNALLTGKGKIHETMPDMCNYMGLIQDHFNNHHLNPITIFNVSGTECQDWMLALRDIISPRPKSSMSDKAKAHLTALLLNMVSGKIVQWAEISEDGATVSQAITYCDILIGDSDPSNDEMAKDIAEMINKGEMIPSDWIDLATPNYLYKMGLGSLPETFALFQNYPNPFNPATNVGFALPKSSQVKLEVFNIMGQKVVTLIDKLMPAGNYFVTWDATKHSSGIYFYHLQADSFIDTKKMLLLK